MLSVEYKGTVHTAEMRPPTIRMMMQWESAMKGDTDVELAEMVSTIDGGPVAEAPMAVQYMIFTEAMLFLADTMGATAANSGRSSG